VKLVIAIHTVTDYIKNTRWWSRSAEPGFWQLPDFSEARCLRTWNMHTL